MTPYQTVLQLGNGRQVFNMHVMGGALSVSVCKREKEGDERREREREREENSLHVELVIFSSVSHQTLLSRWRRYHCPFARISAALHSHKLSILTVCIY